MPEKTIVHAMRIKWSVLEIAVEQSAAVALVVLLDQVLNAVDVTVAILLTGGNVDLVQTSTQIGFEFR